MKDTYPDAPETDDRLVLPEDLVADVPRWLFSKYDDKGKMPRAPWNHPDYPDKYVSHKEPAHWVSGEKLREYMAMYPDHMGYDPAFSIPNYEEDGDTLEGAVARRHVLIDHDNVIVDGKWHPASKKISDDLNTFTQVSASGTGVHNIAEGTLPDPDGDGLTRTTLTLDISNDNFPEAEIEIYDNGRYVHMTGKHVTGTPTECRDVSDLLETWVEEHGDPIEESNQDTRPDVDPEAFDREYTTSKRVMSAAMLATDSDDIYLQSTDTNERSSGIVDMDPSWANSASGTRLAKLGPDHFLYRDGNVKLDTLQVVALEEGIIRVEGDAIEGEKWMQLADALRRRGANIPRYDPNRAGKSQPEASSSSYSSKSSGSSGFPGGW